ncbi:hypothetical protein Tco_0358669, partial [Tanacetum coccineum]
DLAIPADSMFVSADSSIIPADSMFVSADSSFLLIDFPADSKPILLLVSHFCW